LFSADPASKILDEFLQPRGWSLIEVHPVQALYRPKRSLTVRYIVRASPPKGFPRYLALCVRTRHAPKRLPDPPDDFEKMHGLADPVEEKGDLAIWAYPYDPALIGLPLASHGRYIREAAGFEPPAAVSVSPVAYRPGMRAAFRYTVLGRGGVRETLYGKVVEEDAYEKIFTAYNSFEGTGIRMAEPTGAGPSLPGVVLFPPLAGTSLRDTLTEGGNLPSPDKIIDIIAVLNASRVALPPSTLSDYRR
jgi:hypothetical protein